MENLNTLAEKTMENTWDKRYGESEYFYGKAPNDYFKAQIDKLNPGKILLPAEGEGRNAVYAAKRGWSVLAIDMSQMGKEKALKLAQENKVSIQYEVTDLLRYQYPENEYDAVAIIYAHFISSERRTVYRKLAGSLKKGGTLILETFSKKQLGNASGGPQNLDMLNSIEELRADFEGFDFKEFTESEIDLDEGHHHKGKAHVIRILATKKA